MLIWICTFLLFLIFGKKSEFVLIYISERRNDMTPSRFAFPLLLVKQKKKIKWNEWPLWSWGPTNMLIIAHITTVNLTTVGTQRLKQTKVFRTKKVIWSNSCIFFECWSAISVILTFQWNKNWLWVDSYRAGKRQEKKAPFCPFTLVAHVPFHFTYGVGLKGESVVECNFYYVDLRDTFYSESTAKRRKKVIWHLFKRVEAYSLYIYFQL